MWYKLSRIFLIKNVRDTVVRCGKNFMAIMMQCIKYMDVILLNKMVETCIKYYEQYILVNLLFNVKVLSKKFM